MLEHGGQLQPKIEAGQQQQDAVYHKSPDMSRKDFI